MINIITYYGNANQNYIMRSYFTPTGMSMIKNQNKNKTVLTGVIGDVEKLKPSCIAGRNGKWCSHFGKQFGDSSKVTHRVTIWLRYSIPRYIHKIFENMCSKKNSYINVYISIIHNSQNMDITQISINWWMDKPTMEYSVSALKKEWRTIWIVSTIITE